MELTNDTDRLSAAWGITMGRSLYDNGTRPDSFNFEVFSACLKAAMNNEELPMNPGEAGQLLQAEMDKLANAKGNDNLEEGRLFMEENAKKEGVKQTESGLQYVVLQEGEGEKPGPTSQVTTHYQGSYISGQVFDSSYQRGQPATFGLNQVIPGWTEGLQLMTAGSKYRFFVPTHLAYGEKGAGGAIEPNATLLFDVELISIG